MDAGISQGTDGKSESFITYESEYPIPLNQNLIWPQNDAAKRINFEYRTSIAKPTRPIDKKQPTHNFCIASSPENLNIGLNEVSGAYVFDSSHQQVFFELRLNTTRSKEGYSSPIQKMLLGFSEDKDWGNDFVISCDTHRHMSAFGQWKVKYIFHQSLFKYRNEIFTFQYFPTILNTCYVFYKFRKMRLNLNGSEVKV